jgi:hypothetical protein
MFTPPKTIDSEFFHCAFGNPCTMLNKKRSYRAVCGIGNRDGAVALNATHRMGSGRNLLKISLIKIHQMRPFAGSSISLDSTFKVMFLL